MISWNIMLIRHAEVNKTYCVCNDTVNHEREREREIDHLPVNSHAIFSVILNSDKCFVTFFNTKDWPRELTIYCQHALGAT